MKKRTIMKKSIASVIAAAMILTAMPTTIFAEEQISSEENQVFVEESTAIEEETIVNAAATEEDPVVTALDGEETEETTDDDTAEIQTDPTYETRLNVKQEKKSIIYAQDDSAKIASVIFSDTTEDSMKKITATDITTSITPIDLNVVGGDIFYKYETALNSTGTHNILIEAAAPDGVKKASKIIKVEVKQQLLDLMPLFKKNNDNGIEVYLKGGKNVTVPFVVQKVMGEETPRSIKTLKAKDYEIVDVTSSDAGVTQAITDKKIKVSPNKIVFTKNFKKEDVTGSSPYVEVKISHIDESHNYIEEKLIVYINVDEESVPGKAILVRNTGATYLEPINTSENLFLSDIDNTKLVILKKNAEPESNGTYAKSNVLDENSFNYSSDSTLVVVDSDGDVSANIDQFKTSVTLKATKEDGSGSVSLKLHFKKETKPCNAMNLQVRGIDYSSDSPIQKVVSSSNMECHFTGKSRNIKIRARVGYNENGVFTGRGNGESDYTISVTGGKDMTKKAAKIASYSEGLEAHEFIMTEEAMTITLKDKSTNESHTFIVINDNYNKEVRKLSAKSFKMKFGANEHKIYVGKEYSGGKLCLTENPDFTYSSVGNSVLAGIIPSVTSINGAYAIDEDGYAKVSYLMPYGIEYIKTYMPYVIGANVKIGNKLQLNAFVEKDSKIVTKSAVYTFKIQ